MRGFKALQVTMEYRICLSCDSLSGRAGLSLRGRMKEDTGTQKSFEGEEHKKEVT